MLGQILVTKSTEQELIDEGGEVIDGGDGGGGFAPAPVRSANYTLPNSKLTVEVNSSTTAMGMYMLMDFADDFDEGYHATIAPLDLELVNIPLVGVVPDPPSNTAVTNAMAKCQNGTGPCTILEWKSSSLTMNGPDR